MASTPDNDRDRLRVLCVHHTHLGHPTPLCHCRVKEWWHNLAVAVAVAAVAVVAVLAVVAAAAMEAAACASGQRPNIIYIRDHWRTPTVVFQIWPNNAKCKSKCELLPDTFQPLDSIWGRGRAPKLGVMWHRWPRARVPQRQLWKLRLHREHKNQHILQWLQQEVPLQRVASWLDQRCLVDVGSRFRMDILNSTKNIRDTLDSCTLFPMICQRFAVPGRPELIRYEHYSISIRIPAANPAACCSLLLVLITYNLDTFIY